MLSKYMKAIVAKLTDVNFRFFDASQGGAAEKAVTAFWDALDSDIEAAAKMRMTTLTLVRYYKPNSDTVAGADLYRCPDTEALVCAKVFETDTIYDAYGTHDVEIDGKTVRILNNYGDEDGNGDRVGEDNYVWYSPCIMYEQSGKLTFELVDLVIPKAEFGLHKPYVYRHAIAYTDIPGSLKDFVGRGKRAFFYGKNWLLRADMQDNVFSIRHSLEPKAMKKLGLKVTQKTQHIRLGDFNLCVSDGMLIIPANEKIEAKIE